ncbi:uncharacterized protein LOC110102472, partial [Dendrobium catenatum]|uniref:uncharacterized protein LOC110102472 n=1 Tax=Dendrobium catenatum TaxID=906689 RepID=UPI00109F2C06
SSNCKEQKRVVFVEAGSDFIDVLFSFLTLPLGSIIRLLGKQTDLGSLDSLYKKNNNVLYSEVVGDFLNYNSKRKLNCINNKFYSEKSMTCTFLFAVWISSLITGKHFTLGSTHALGMKTTNLYKSIEQIDVKHLQTEACKKMLLKPQSAAVTICEPRSAAVTICNDLKIKNNHDVNPRHFYICNESVFNSILVLLYLCNYFSLLEELRIKDADILEEMVINISNDENKTPKLKNRESDSGRGFVEDERRFMVSDNLQISPISSISAITKGIDFLIYDPVKKEVSIDKAKENYFLLGIYAIFALLINFLFYSKCRFYHCWVPR